MWVYDCILCWCSQVCAQVYLHGLIELIVTTIIVIILAYIVYGWRNTEYLILMVGLVWWDRLLRKWGNLNMCVESQNCVMEFFVTLEFFVCFFFSRKLNRRNYSRFGISDEILSNNQLGSQTSFVCYICSKLFYELCLGTFTWISNVFWLEISVVNCFFFLA